MPAVAREGHTLERPYTPPQFLPRTYTKVRHSVSVSDDLHRLKPLRRQPTDKELPGQLGRSSVSTERGLRSGASSTTIDFHECIDSRAHSLYTTAPIQAIFHKNINGNRPHLQQLSQTAL